MIILSVGTELFHAGGWTEGQTDRQRDMRKLIGTFRNFAKAPENLYLLKHTKK